MKFIDKIRNIAKATAEASVNSAVKEAKDYYINHIQKGIEEMARRGASSYTLPFRPSYYETIKRFLEQDGFAIHAKTIEDGRGYPKTTWVIEW